jgi:hypothetical protein
LNSSEISIEEEEEEEEVVVIFPSCLGEAIEMDRLLVLPVEELDRLLLPLLFVLALSRSFASCWLFLKYLASSDASTSSLINFLEVV